MDPRPRVERATRFFARLRSFDLECPHCGQVYSVTDRKPTSNYDPRTGRFHCNRKDCNRRYILGVLAWPITAGGGSATPEDQVPSPRQLVQMRREGGGWWLADQDAQKWKRPIETNLTLEEDRPDDQDEDE